MNAERAELSRPAAITLMVVAGCAGEAGEEGNQGTDRTAMSDRNPTQGGADADFVRQMSDHHEGLVDG